MVSNLHPESICDRTIRFGKLTVPVALSWSSDEVIVEMIEDGFCDNLELILFF
jgi:hypothetical protein